MLFSEGTLREAWRLARGRCECQREGHGHQGRCNRELRWERLGYLGEGGWQANGWGWQDDPDNCEVLCVECYATSQRET